MTAGVAVDCGTPADERTAIQTLAGPLIMALDTVNPHGGWQGSIDEARLGWPIDWTQQGRLSECVRTRDQRRARSAMGLAASNDQLPNGSIRSIALDSFSGARNTTWVVPDPPARL